MYSATFCRKDCIQQGRGRVCKLNVKGSVYKDKGWGCVILARNICWCSPAARAASHHAGPIFCSVRVRDILIVAPRKWLTSSSSRLVIAILYEFVKIPGPSMFIHFPFHSHNPSMVVLTGAEDITNKSRVSVYLDIILIIPPCWPDQTGSGVNIDLCSAGRRETVPCPSDDQRTLISDSLFADLTPPAQCFWTLNCDGLRVCGKMTD